MKPFDYIKQYRKYFILGGIIILVLAGLLFISYGYYPIAFVNHPHSSMGGMNGTFISARTFLKNYGVASVYYANFLKTYQPTASDAARLSSDDISRAVMDQLVENVLIDQGAEKEVGGDLGVLVKEKVDQASSDPELGKKAEALYGLSIGDFREKVLKPQAERDILTGRLFLRGEKIDDWLANAKQSSRVVFFSGRFHWNGTSVENR